MAVDEDRPAAPVEKLATLLKDSLKSCHAIVDDYRAKLAAKKPEGADQANDPDPGGGS